MIAPTLDLAPTALAARAGVDPWRLLAQLAHGSPKDVDDLGGAFAVASGDAEAAGELADQAQTLAGAGYTVDRLSPAQEAAAVTAYRGSRSPAAVAGALVAIARILFGVADELAARTTAAAAAVDALGAELTGLSGQYAAGVAAFCALPPVTRQALGASYLDDLVDGFRQRAVGRVQEWGEQLRMAVAQYEAVLATRLHDLAALGFVPPPELDDRPGDPTSPVPSPGTDPALVASWWAGLTWQQHQALLTDDWTQLAQVEGLPAAVADEVNRRELAEDVTTQAAQVRRLTDQIEQVLTGASGADLTTPAGAMAAGYVVQRLRARLAAARQRLTNATTTLGTLIRNPDALVLRYDDWGKQGEGTAVIAVGGDPDTAANLALSVPGTGCDVSEDGTDGLRPQIGRARRLLTAMDDAAPASDNVVIVYQGYQEPDDLAAATSASYAEDAAAQLVADSQGWAAAQQQAQGRTAYTTIVAHSYGTLLGAKALQGGMQVDAFVVVGSPGLGVPDAQSLLPHAGRVWVGAADGDPITSDALSIYSPGYWNADPTRPQDPQFGADVFSTGSARGHSEYFDDVPGTSQPDTSLANIGEIATDNADRVVRSSARGRTLAALVP